MKNKVQWAYLIGGIAIIILVLGIVFAFSGVLKRSPPGSLKQQGNQELSKYRSSDIPEECRLPEGDSDVEWWKQHLSHHEPTWYCLKYYGTTIEKMKGGE